MITRLVNILSSVILLIFFADCNSDKQAGKRMEGDLYYSWLRIGNFYNLPDSVIKKVKLYADTVNRKQLGPDDLKTLAMYEILKKENLLYNPFIDLKLDNDSIIKIYMTTEDYEKVNFFKRQDLIDTKKKIRINTEVRDLGLGMALLINIITVKKIDGQTLQINKKFQVEDYR